MVSGVLTNCNMAYHLPACGPQDELVLQEWEHVGQQAPGRRTWSRHSVLGGGQSWGQQSTSPCWAGNKDKFPFEKRQRNPHLNINVNFLQIQTLFTTYLNHYLKPWAIYHRSVDSWKSPHNIDHWIWIQLETIKNDLRGHESFNTTLLVHETSS